MSNFTEISTSHNRICNFLLSLPLLVFPCTSSLFRYKGGRGNGKDSYGHLSFTHIRVILSCAVGCVVFAVSSVYTKHTFSWLSFWRNWLTDFFSPFFQPGKVESA